MPNTQTSQTTAASTFRATPMDDMSAYMKPVVLARRVASLGESLRCSCGHLNDSHSDVGCMVRTGPHYCVCKAALRHSGHPYWLSSEIEGS